MMRKALHEGKDICAVMDWIEQNQDKFVGKVYTPILLNVS
jgi:hypothetical protein